MLFTLRFSRVWLIAVVTTSAAFMAGCASNAANSGFGQVQEDVLDRGGQQVFWNTASADDARADAAVARLLEQNLTADTAVQTALLNNRNLQATFEEIGIAQADLVRAGLLKNPIFNGAYEFASGGGLAKVNLSVTEDFLSILQIPLQKRVAGARLETARLQAADAVLNLTAQVRSAFYEYQAAQQILSLRNTANAGKKAAAEVAARLHQAGNISDLDLANEQAMAGQSALDATAAESEAKDRREILNELMGLSDLRAAEWESVGILPDAPVEGPPLKNLQTLALQQRLDLVAARQQTATAAGELGIATQFALLPDASAGPSAEREHDGTWETGPQISLPIPLFDLGGASAAAARARMRQAQRRYEAMVIEVQTQVRRAQNKMDNSAQAVRCYRDSVLPARQQIVDQTMLRYNGMFASVFQLLAAKDAQLDAQAGCIQATRDYWIASAELDRAVGEKAP